jgi:RHS repeat-associated protein
MNRRIGTAVGLIVLLALLSPARALAQTPPAVVVEYYHLDALGSVRVVTDQNQNVVARHDFLPFGEEWNPPANAKEKKLFTGHERDANTGLDYFGARYYRPQVGRFTTVDPLMTVGENLVDPQRWNRYAYAKNNPIRYVDPDGRDVTPVVVTTADGPKLTFVDTRIARMFAQFLEHARAEGIEPIFNDVFRSYARQEELAKLSPNTASKGTSPHLVGLASDINTKHPSMTAARLKRLHTILSSLNFQNVSVGGVFEGWHYQYTALITFGPDGHGDQAFKDMAARNQIDAAGQWLDNFLSHMLTQSLRTPMGVVTTTYTITYSPPK